MTASILLDTCAALWIVAEEEISRSAVDALLDAYREGRSVYVSPITAWEVGMLASKGRFRSNMSPQRWLDELLAKPGVRLAELTAFVLMGSSFLPGGRLRDPADRIIVATAREYGMTVMTRDQLLLDYGKQGYLSVLAC